LASVQPSSTEHPRTKQKRVSKSEGEMEEGGEEAEDGMGLTNLLCTPLNDISEIPGEILSHSREFADVVVEVAHFLMGRGGVVDGREGGKPIRVSPL